MTLNLNVGFDGGCEAAFRLYERCLGGKIAYMLKWGDSPAAGEAPAEWHGKIYHATLNVAGTVLNGGDVAPGKYESPKGVRPDRRVVDVVVN
jgi:PhnB protein